MASASLADRFWAKVTRLGPDDCWLFTASGTENGYGLFWADLGDGPRLHTAQRVAFFLHNGRAPAAALDVMHSCDVRRCCNGAHLEEGTRTDNMRDAARKGRTRRTPTVLGEQCRTAKLTAPRVLEIRARAAAGEPYAPLSAEFGVVYETIGNIVRRVTWRHV